MDSLTDGFAVEDPEAAEPVPSPASGAEHPITISTLSETDSSDELSHFVQQMTASQNDLRAYILSALGNYPNTEDVLQRTNVTLWKKAEDYEHGTNFGAWARAIARFEILRFYRDSKRDRHVFDLDVAEMMLATADQVRRDPSDRQESLRECLKKLPPPHRVVLWRRYDEGLSVKQIAAESGRSVDAIKSLLLRIRRTLEECIRIRQRAESN